MGLLLSVPTESIAIRVIVASVAAAWLGRLLLRAGLRVPGVRAATALVPAGALLAVVLFSWSSLRLPLLMLPVDAVDALPVPVRDSYLHFAPMAVPLLLGGWAVVVATRIGCRVRRVQRLRREVTTGADERVGRRVRQLVAATAAEMRVAVPPVAVVPSCPGGASAIGIRRPMIVLDARLVGDLDDEELEGVVAHELAHVRRRDNLVSLALGIVRDVFFFVPGGRWALNQLHRERELAADQLAARTTGRPAALASGLLKVLDAGRPNPVCAALVPGGGLVGRVQYLVEERPAVSRVRGTVEVAAVVLTLTVAVVAAMALPALAVGAGGARDAVALVWTSVTDQVSTPEASVEPRAFQVYRRSELEKPTTTTARSPMVDDDPDEVSRTTLAACASDAGAAMCPERHARTSLPLRPRPIIRVDTRLTDQLERWRAEPVVRGDNGLSVYWLQLRGDERLR